MTSGATPSVLLVHNRYINRGGEDMVFEREAEMLRSRGHRVELFVLDNKTIPKHVVQRLRVAHHAITGGAIPNHIGSIVDRGRFDIVHFHNTFPMVSPAAYKPARDAGAAIVQTLHNYRVTCANALLLRDAKPCTACVGASVPWRGALYGCYRDSRAQSAVHATMLAVHRWRGTFADQVDRYIALSEFAKDVFVRCGLDKERIAIKRNGALDVEQHSVARRGALFVGRLSPEKGVDRLIQCWPKLSRSCDLTIVGPGALQKGYEGDGCVKVLGPQSAEKVASLMAAAAFVVVPSECFESGPVVIPEAFRCGTPVIASDIGAMKELVELGKTGLRFDSSSDAALLDVLRWAVDHPEEMRTMGRNARMRYEGEFSSEAQYSRLSDIYAEAIEWRHRKDKP